MGERRVILLLSAFKNGGRKEKNIPSWYSIQCFVNHLPDNKILALFKLKAFADKIDMAQMLQFQFDREENHCKEKEKIALRQRDNKTISYKRQT